ncbi:MAG: MATE family efflux transporter [Thermodesulfobacteriota bacterium]
MPSLKRRWNAEGGYRELLALAVPLIISTGAWSVQHFVDRMFLAWYSAEALAASVPAGLLNFSIMCLFLGVAGYVSTFVAQYHGAGRPRRIGPTVWQGLYVSVLGGLFLLALAPLAEPIFNLVGHDESVRRLEIIYFRILCLGGFPAIAAAAVSGFFAGLGKPWPVMWINLLSMGVNMSLNYLFIFGRGGFPEMGIAGAGLATVLAGTFSLAAFLILIWTPGHNRTYRTLEGWRPEADLFIRLLRYGLPSGVEMFMDLSGFSIFVLLVGRLGTNDLAATNIALNINMLAFLPMLGSGLAVSVLVGRYLGAERPGLAQKSAYSGFHLTLLYMGLVAAAYVLAPRVFVAPFAAKADPERFAEILDLSVVLLRFVAAYSLFDAMSIIFCSAIKGAGDTRFVMLMLGSVSLGVLILPTYLAVAVFNFGVKACWLAATFYSIVLAFAFYSRFRGGKWRAMRVIESRPV